MSEEHGRIPDGWAYSKIEDFARTATGGTPSRKKKEYYGGTIPWVKSGDLKDGKVSAVDESITKEGLRNSNAKVFPKGTVCIALYGATVGKLGVLDLDAATNQAVCGVFPYGDILPPYLFHCLRNERSNLIAKAKGGAQPNISNGIVKETELPVPPLNEQRRIVAKIEALQERSRKAREALSEVGPLLEQCRRSLLAAAFRGDLTADWRAENPDVEPASQLLARIRQERRERWEQAELAKYEAKGKKPPKGWKEKYQQPEPVDDSELPELPEGWCWCTVRDIGDVQLGRQRAPKYHSGPNMRPYLRVMNVYEDRIDTNDIMEMDFSDEEFERYRLESGDILLNEGQSKELVGRPAIYRGELPGACFTNTLVRFRAETGIDCEYPQIVFLGYLKTGRFQQIASLTVNIAHLGAGRFAELAFPLPPLKEQAEIVRKVRKALQQVKVMKEYASSTLSELESLNQSILAKAFRGELVPQDPNDEPASVLLDRIREQRETVGKKAKKPARRNRAEHPKQKAPATTAPPKVSQCVLLLLKVWGKPVSFPLLEAGVRLMLEPELQDAIVKPQRGRRKTNAAAVPLLMGMDQIYRSLVSKEAISLVGKHAYQLNVENKGIVGLLDESSFRMAENAITALESMMQRRKLDEEEAGIAVAQMVSQPYVATANV